MKNEQRTNSRSSSFGKSKSKSESISESRDESSDRIRKNDRIATSDAGQVDSIRNGETINEFSSSNNQSATQQFTIPSDHYFTPDGRVERIPSGYTIGLDGRLRKQRKRHIDSESSDRKENGGRNSDQEEIFSSEMPLRVGRIGRPKKKLSETQERLILVTSLSVASTALFSTVSIFAGKHWQLESEEAQILAKNLNEAIATLPSKTYAQILAIIEKWVPWFNLSFTLGAILYPRFEQSIQQFEERDKKNDFSNVTESRGSQLNNEFDRSSLGWNDK